MDTQETIWQLNWVTVTAPAANENIKTNAGDRIWFQLPMKDFSGHLTLFITQSAALKLAQVETTEKFEQLHSEDRLAFPMFAAVKKASLKDKTRWVFQRF